MKPPQHQAKMKQDLLDAKKTGPTALIYSFDA